MHQHLAAVSVVIPDYEAAIAHYVGTLGFELCEDEPLSATKRWVTVAPPGSGAGACRLVLAKASGPAQQAAVGQQTGGRVFLFLHTDDFDRDYTSLLAKGVRFIEKPRLEPYGKVVVFEDAFGNLWDLVEPVATR